jgi:hypothetical protein
MLELSLPELDLLMNKVTAGDQTPETHALAERIRHAQDNYMYRRESARRVAEAHANFNQMVHG